MDLARRMQMNLLPGTIPETPRYNVAARCRPASKVGGDVYDIVRVDADGLAVFMGDAVGHGIDSGLLAATAMGVYRATVHQDPDPEHILSGLDRSLRSSSRPGFITAGCLFCSPGGDELLYGLAGQEAPIVIRSGRIVDGGMLPSSLPLGVNLPPNYHRGSMPLQPGDLIAVLSDGFLETRNVADEIFETRLHRFLEEQSGDPLPDLIEKLFLAADDFRGVLPQKDDLTVVLVRVKEWD